MGKEIFIVKPQTNILDIEHWCVLQIYLSVIFDGNWERVAQLALTTTIGLSTWTWLIACFLIWFWFIEKLFIKAFMHCNFYRFFVIKSKYSLSISAIMRKSVSFSLFQVCQRFSWSLLGFPRSLWALGGEWCEICLSLSNKNLYCAWFYTWLVSTKTDIVVGVGRRLWGVRFGKTKNRN